ncbi:MAG: PHP domain-containing protein [Peptococcia bacterium]|jgi:predicted metal-dependent phosphoesterase TrpH
MAVDLHIHTNASSDGQYTAQEIVEMAQKIGLETIAITDHDSVAAVEAGMMWGAKYKLEVIPGCELFSLYKERTLHILGYYIDPLNPELQDICQRAAEDRTKQIDRQIEVLRAGGYYLEKEKVLGLSPGNPPLYSNYVEAIFEDERNKNNQIVKEYKQKSMGIIDFCHDFMCLGKIFYISQYIPDAELVLKVIQQSGGVPVLAHPAINLKKDDYQILDELVEMGLVGLEVYTSHHTPEDEQFYASICREKGLIYTCGSDFHGFYKPHVKMGDIKNNTKQVAEALKATWEAKRKTTHNI